MANTLSQPLSFTRWLAPLVDEATFDFYARRINPAWRWSRVICRVAKIESVAADMVAFTLKPNRNWGGFEAGQHLQVYVEINGVRHSRSYSMTNIPNSGGEIQFAVKRVPGGLVSNWLHDQIKVGAYIEVGQAFGNQKLPCNQPLLLIAGGSGITPVMSWLQKLARHYQHADVVLLQYSRDQATLPFQKQLKQLAATMPNFQHLTIITDRPGQPPIIFDDQQLSQLVPDAQRRAAFACGPASLANAVRDLWHSRQYTQPLLTEAFSPPALPSGDSVRAVALSYSRSGKQQQGNSGATLLQQAETHGLKPTSGCRMGICFSCVCKKESGTVHNLLTGETSSEPGEMIRICVSTPVSDVTLDL